MELMQRMLLTDMPDEPFPPIGRGHQDPDAARRLAEAARADMIPIAPGVRIWKPKPGSSVPECVLCRWIAVKEGYTPVPIAGRYVRLTSALAAQMGFRDADRSRRYDTLLRLWRAGFVEIAHVSPGVYMLEMDSWHRHLSEVCADERYWDVGNGNREKYFEANGLGGWKAKE